MLRINRQVSSSNLGNDTFSQGIYSIFFLKNIILLIEIIYHLTMCNLNISCNYDPP
jgi:hypothetical protein